MGLDIKYKVVEKYTVTAELTQPMHIGSAGGSKGEILIHPVDDVPFIQASGIAGVFRSYCTKYYSEDIAKKFFGESRVSDKETSSAGQKKVSENADQGVDSDVQSRAGSRLKISDGYFLTSGTVVDLQAEEKEAGIQSGIGLELRPRVEINPVTGSAAASRIKGSGKTSGHKFETEYIGAGALCRFTVYDMSPDVSVDIDNKSEGRRLMECIFAAMNSEDIQFGGQKSNGCGYMKVESVKFKRFDLTDRKQLRLWINEDSVIDKDMETITVSAQGPSASAYRITVTGKTENRLLVKAIAVENKDGSSPDARNMQNHAGEYIVPASSFKGAVRARTEKVLKYLVKDKRLDVSDILQDSFGSNMARDTNTLGNLRFFDTIVRDVWDDAREKQKEKSDVKSGMKGEAATDLARRASVDHKIHIDKFTGGVMNKALVTENTIGGEITFRINILNMKAPDKTCAILLMVLRDLANGQFNIGSGYASGKGFIDVHTITVDAGQEEAVLDFENGTVTDEHAIIRRCMDSLKRKEAV
ncbi:MAG TPA: hypothetical protein DEO87_05585 [Lachnospiraceae bacterium]|nr:hypothetical protein [Lachnospiraceae bacterium]